MLHAAYTWNSDSICILVFFVVCMQTYTIEYNYSSIAIVSMQVFFLLFFWFSKEKKENARRIRETSFTKEWSHVFSSNSIVVVELAVHFNCGKDCIDAHSCVTIKQPISKKLQDNCNNAIFIVFFIKNNKRGYVIRSCIVESPTENFTSLNCCCTTTTMQKIWYFSGWLDLRETLFY